MKNLKTISGFTLIELMIGMVISLIIVAGAVHVYSEIIRASIFEIRAANASNQLNDVVERMARDIRRAGYIGHTRKIANDTSDIKVNIYDAEIANLTAADYPSGVTLPNGTSINSPSSNCILYAFNHDDSVSGAVSSADFSGFLFIDGELLKLTALNDGHSLECNKTKGEWDSIVDREQIVIQGVEFSLTPRVVSGADIGEATIRSVTLSVSGESKLTTKDGSQSFAITKTVELPNIRLVYE